MLSRTLSSSVADTPVPHGVAQESHESDTGVGVIHQLSADAKSVFVEAERGSVGCIFIDDFVEEHPRLYGYIKDTACRIVGLPFRPPYLLLSVDERFERVAQVLELVGRNDLAQYDVAVIEQLLGVDRCH